MDLVLHRLGCSPPALSWRLRPLGRDRRPVKQTALGTAARTRFADRNALLDSPRFRNSTRELLRLSARSVLYSCPHTSTPPPARPSISPWSISSTTSCDYEITSPLAYETARYCLLDTLGCGLQALDYPACTKLLGPLVPGLTMRNGARVPGTNFELDPVQAAFNIGAIIRWLDFNDTWLAAEWGHPSDNLGAHPRRRRLAHAATAASRSPMRDVLTAMIKAHEIQGCLALENSFNKVGLDHVVLVKVAHAPQSSARCSASPAIRSSTR